MWVNFNKLLLWINKRYSCSSNNQNRPGLYHVWTHQANVLMSFANLFMCHFENIWLENCPAHFKPIVYRRFVDDTFLLFRTKDHVEKFKNYLNKQHKNIKFTSEIEENGSLSFLDITTSRENNKFVTPVYRKPTFSGVLYQKCTNVG